MAFNALSSVIIILDVFLTRLLSLSSCGIVKRRVRGCIIDERQSIASQWPTLAAFNSKRK
jgi:hypothetical protein